MKSLLIAISFISIIPVPKKFLPDWNNKTLRFFCVMLPIVGAIFGLFWLTAWLVLERVNFSANLRGFVMTLFTLALTGGLHLDGLMDTCDAIFSHRDRDTRLKILSDTHAGAFAVMGCVVIFLAKTFLFAEIFTNTAQNFSLFFVPVYSRLGMAALLSNLPFAKSGGLAVILGTARRKSDNLFLAVIFGGLCVVCGSKILAGAFVCMVLVWAAVCVRIFGGITGDLLGAFVELSEVVMLAGLL